MINIWGEFGAEEFPKGLLETVGLGEEAMRVCNEPAIVLMPNLISALSPVVVCQAKTPDYTACKKSVKPLRGKARHMRVDHEMGIVHRREKAPHAVYLRVVPIGIGDNPENWKADVERERERCDNRVCR